MKNSNNEYLQKLRHSAAHLAAHAVLELFPDTLLTIGPATPEGFFYDILPSKNLKEEDLELIEKKMHEIADRNLVITHQEIPKDEARGLFGHNSFKMELIESIPGATVGLSQQGNFIDLCKGGHVHTTGEIKHFKLLGLSGSYWHADKKNKALQRISGTAFATEQELQEFITRREEAAKYDHRKLGKQLNLFSFHEEGVGFPFFHPKGKAIVNTLITYLRTLQNKMGYQEISTPILLSDELWKRSGHYKHYKENMYFCMIDDKSYAIKPMNCPGAFLVYKERPHSYRELPMKLAEFGLVHRHELSGVLHGLMRVRSFTQDDAHIICTPDQLGEQIQEAIKLIYTVLKRFHFDTVKVAVSTKPEHAMGSDELWEIATKSLEEALEKEKIPYTVQPGEGAFYGPKIEFVIQDSMQREWQCGTIQVDFFQPENFDLTYVSPEGTKKRPVVIHRAIYGSLERFFAILLEHYKGVLPFWLAPEQIRVLTITDDQLEYAKALVDHFKRNGFRIDMDMSSDPISGKIKNAQLDKIPWMIVIGKKEMAQNTYTLRHQDGSQEPNLSFEKLIAKAENALIY